MPINSKALLVRTPLTGNVFQLRPRLIFTGIPINGRIKHPVSGTCDEVHWVRGGSGRERLNSGDDEQKKEKKKDPTGVNQGCS